MPKIAFSPMNGAQAENLLGSHSCFTCKKIFFLGGSPGLVVMGGDSCSEGSGFEFRRRIKDGHDICSH